MSAPRQPTAPRQRAFVAVYLLFRRGDALLMMRRANTGYHDGEWTLPAGHVDEGESILAAASREALEEVGLTVSDWQMAAFLHRKTPERHIVDVFLIAQRWQGEPGNCEPDRCDALEFFPLWQRPEPQVSYVAEMINAIVSASHLPLYAEKGWD